MKILLSNDDGIYAKGIQVAASVLRKFGRVTVVAPNQEQSSVSSKITTHHPLRAFEIQDIDADKAYAVNGTPADCVKLAISELCEDRPDIVISGINHGSNTGMNVVYSGTVAACVEACLLEIPSIAFSLCSIDQDAMDLSALAVQTVLENIDLKKFPENTLLNVNVPAVGVDEYKGIEVCALSRNRYVEDFDIRKDPKGRTYYWLGGIKTNHNDEFRNDDLVVSENKIAVSPMKIDFNDFESVNNIKTWF